MRWWSILLMIAAFGVVFAINTAPMEARIYCNIIYHDFPYLCILKERLVP